MKRISLEEHLSRLARRRRELGIAPDASPPANTGRRRTPEKRALLEAIAKNAKEAGRKPRFKAKH
jgi:hypothetical protein